MNFPTKCLMEITLLKLGCDGGDISLQRSSVNGFFLFKVKAIEFFDEPTEKTTTYLTIDDAWHSFKIHFPEWHRLYLVSINAQMIDIIKGEYLAVTAKNEYTMDRWLQQLIGDGIGF